MSDVRRQVVLTPDYHHLLVHLLTGLLERGDVGEPTRKLRNIVKSAKFVTWDDEAKLWVGPRHPED